MSFLRLKVKSSSLSDDEVGLKRAPSDETGCQASCAARKRSHSRVGAGERRLDLPLEGAKDMQLLAQCCAVGVAHRQSRETERMREILVSYDTPVSAAHASCWFAFQKDLREGGFVKTPIFETLGVSCLACRRLSRTTSHNRERRDLTWKDLLAQAFVRDHLIFRIVHCACLLSVPTISGLAFVRQMDVSRHHQMGLRSQVVFFCSFRPLARRYIPANHPSLSCN